MTAVTKVLGRLRQPEYTGENRCVPCTAVNLLFVGVLGAGVGLATTPVVGALAVGAGAVVIYLRGYLVPGTPSLTRRYFPPWLLRGFGKAPVSDHTIERDLPDADADDPLAAAGIVTPGEVPDLTPAFREEWHARMARLGENGVGPGDVAAAFGGESADRLGAASFVLDGQASLRWGSETALRADVAAASLLSERLDGWPEYDRDTRRSVLMGLRLCLETCPACGGAVRVGEDRVDPCCEKPHLVADAVCADCGAALADAAVVDSEDQTTVRASLLDT